MRQAYYCQGLDLGSLSKGATDAQSGMTQLSTPLSAFNCDLSRVDQIGFQVRGVRWACSLHALSLPATVERSALGSPCPGTSLPPWTGILEAVVHRPFCAL